MSASVSPASTISEGQGSAFETLFGHAPGATLMLDGHGVIVHANGAAEKLFASSSPIGLALGQLVEDKQRQLVNELLADPGCGAARLELDFPRLGPNRTRLRLRVMRCPLSNPVSERGSLVALEPVDALSRGESTELDSLPGLRTLLSSCPDGLAVLRNDRIELCNPALEKQVGLDARKSLGGRPLSQLLVEAERKQLLAALRETERGASSVSVEVHFDKGGLPVELRMARIRYQHEVRVLVVAREVSNRMRQAADRAHDTRLESLGLLVAGFAHELNNPLSFVLPNLEDAAERLSSVPPDMLFGVGTVGEITELIRDVRVGVERVAAVVNDLQIFHRVNETRVPVDANRVVAEALDTARAKLSRVVVERDLGRVEAIFGNPGRLGQVVQNLLLNAVQAMPPRRAKGDNRIQLKTWQSLADVHIEIRDNGAGIEAGDLEHLFDPFFKKRQGGTGLGLTVCQSLVRQMGGWIEVASIPGEGTRFTLHFPASQASTLPPLEAPAPDRVPIAGRHLLVVDDEPLICRTIRRLLAGRFELTMASSGREAIQQLESGAEVDCIMTDLVMRNGTGLDLYRWVSENRPALRGRVVFMTGMAHPDSLDELPDAPRLSKPFGLAELEHVFWQVFSEGPEHPPQR